MRGNAKPTGLAFPREEFDARRSNVRTAMVERDIDGLLIASPGNIYYLTGLDHWGFSATHVLVVPCTACA
ncbi:MAG: aminopeptidase P family N-terminal domain-containing protein [Acidiferrobacterales bacterium]